MLENVLLCITLMLDVISVYILHQAKADLGSVASQPKEKRGTGKSTLSPPLIY